jgi:hypothetical protein
MQWNFEDFMFSFNYFQIVEVGGVEVVLSVFFTLPNSPTDLKPTIIEPTLSTLHCHYTPSPSRFKRLLNLHEKIVEELFDP